MSPILRIRRVIRSIGGSSEEADEFAEAMSEYPGRSELKLMIDEAFSSYLVQTLLGVLIIVSVAVGVIAVLMVALD